MIWATRWKVKRRIPYTRRGIARIPCIRCGSPAKFQWNLCSDGGHYRPLCLACDVALNRLVLAWMGHPEAQALANSYQAKKEAE